MFIAGKKSMGDWDGLVAQGTVVERTQDNNISWWRYSKGKDDRKNSEGKLNG